ncbi:Uncharacterised protein [Mycobacterium tuberculosis]|nr:Uncharacterised protein [Mycobacterium tuberculosis]
MRSPAPSAGTATCGDARQRGCTVDKPGSASVCNQAQSPSIPTPSTRGTARYGAAQRSRRASLAKSAVPLLATLMNSQPAPMPESTRKVTPPSSLTHTARTGLPTANRATIAGSAGGDEGKDTAHLFRQFGFSPLWAACSRDH